MNNTAEDNAIYCNGRTFEQHCTWLDSLTGDEYRMVHLPIGHLFNIAVASWLKRFLVKFSTTAEVRQRALDSLSSMAFGPVTSEAIAVIEPADVIGAEIIRTITALPVSQQTRAFQDGDVFRLVAQLNPSLLKALRLSTFVEPIPGENHV